MPTETLPRWVDNHPGLRAVVHPVSQLLRDAVEHADAEFEVRLMRTKPRWSSDTGETYLDFLSRCSDAGTSNALAFGDWAEHTDFFYESDGQPVRSRVQYDGDAYDVRTTTTTTQRLGRVDLNVADSPWGLRVDARRETEVAPAQLPAAVRRRASR